MASSVSSRFVRTHVFVLWHRRNQAPTLQWRNVSDGAFGRTCRPATQSLTCRGDIRACLSYKRTCVDAVAARGDRAAGRRTDPCATAAHARVCLQRDDDRCRGSVKSQGRDGSPRLASAPGTSRHGGRAAPAEIHPINCDRTGPPAARNSWSASARPPRCSARQHRTSLRLNGFPSGVLAHAVEQPV